MVASALALVGRSTRRRTDRAFDRVRFLGATVRAAFSQTSSLPLFGNKVVLNQIRFTAVQALPFLSSIAFMIGVTVMVQVSAQAMRLGVSDVLGPVLVSVIVRELGPLLTAIVVIGRSGTAIAAELSTNTVLGETEALESMGIDPLQHFVLPRIVGVTASVTLLNIYFNAITLTVGGVAGEMMGIAPMRTYLESLRLSLTPADLWLTVIKGSVFGLGIALLCSYEGLSGGKRATAIPQCVTRGVVSSLFFVFFTSALFSIAFYL